MTRFRAIPNEVDFPAVEREVLRRWEEDGTFERSVRAREGGRRYTFYDGPPFATGLPHYGHILTSYIKDIVPRYYTMRGYHVPRRWGWDCHGLPVEYEVEKELGFKSRADILEHGIASFNAACRSTVLRYADEWRRIITRLGRWVDFDHDYKTMEPDYMESVVWIFKSLWERGLVYEGNKVVAYCTRCQTPLSNFEARQDDAFRPRQDPAITVRFRRRDDPNQVFLAWTTTPWTLPSNAALAVGPDIEYVAMEKDGETVWLATDAIARFPNDLDGFVERTRVRGVDLVGVQYLPIFSYFSGGANAFRVLSADFVSTDEGTGIVHLAPAFGEDDSSVCSLHGIDGPNPVGDDGTFDASVADFAGQHVHAANDGIIRKLKTEGSLFRRETTLHNYPHCWRCDSPLLYRAIRAWFVRVTDVKPQMIAANKRIRWVPEHVRDGRFGDWLENARDWAVSRNRFWGAPIPVWRCETCAAIEVIGSRKDLEGRSGQPLADWHRPAVDEIRLACDCGGTMTRVPDVLDCWFESGAMPYAQGHYPFEGKQEFEVGFPADFIVEYIAQTRGWFYTLVVLAAALFDEPPFKNVVCHGVILAEDGRKMSKRLKNYPDPMELVEKHGSDALRVALLWSAATRGSDLRFSGESVRDAVRRFCIPLWNCVHYFTAYAAIDEFEPSGAFPALTRLDRYLLSETERLRATLDERMEAYNLAGAYDAIEDYIVMLSTWYVRLSRQRLWQSGMADDKRTALEVLYAALQAVTRLIAPFLPFLAESIYAALGGEGSVHCQDWPTPHQEWRDHELSAEMGDIRTLVRLVRGVREANRIGHRQPLRSIDVANLPEETLTSNLDLLLNELNVKEVRHLDSLEGHVLPVVKLDYTRLGKRLRKDLKTVATAIEKGEYELLDGTTRLRVAGHDLSAEDFSFRYAPKAEGMGVATAGKLVVVVNLTVDPALLVEKHVRDLNRAIQDLRKEAGLAYQDRIVLGIAGPEAFATTIVPHLQWIKEQVLAVEIADRTIENAAVSRKIEIGGDGLIISLRRA